MKDCLVLGCPSDSKTHKHSSSLELALHVHGCGLPRRCSGKESTCQCRRHKRCGFNPWSGRSPGGGNGNRLQYPCLENSIDRGARWATVCGDAKNWTWLSKWTHMAHTPMDVERTDREGQLYYMVSMDYITLYYTRLYYFLFLCLRKWV